MISSVLDWVHSGLVSGIIATVVMTLTEIPSWRKWGLLGVFEWHENQILSTRLFDISLEKINFKHILFLHFVNGALGGAAFALLLSFFSITKIQDHILLLSVLYAIALWIATLVPIHKPITGHSLWNHDLGHLPAVASLIGHSVYGLILGIVISIMV